MICYEIFPFVTKRNCIEMPYGAFRVHVIVVFMIPIKFVFHFIAIRKLAIAEFTCCILVLKSSARN